ncbi:GNAT family N-acetyltransferase [Microbulbifer guangxiensis]|uniref:GNAT family N-acetyltransferase n=1 Tax=Microbulbifer guangxiensis TaxID=2904249 RepID=UPI001F28E340|nr:GNAT family N-acetyltransferase [Microbulbifer guangxiensis]
MRIDNLSDQPTAVDMLASWHFDEWRHLYPDETHTDFAEDLRRSLERGAVPATWVLVDDEGVWGSASVLEQDMETNRELGPWLANVYVHPRHRGRGLGSQLIRHVMAQCQARGLPALYLFTPGQEIFYETLGWQRLRRERYHGEVVTIMQARLGED